MLEKSYFEEDYSSCQYKQRNRCIHSRRWFG